MKLKINKCLIIELNIGKHITF